MDFLGRSIQSKVPRFVGGEQAEQPSEREAQSADARLAGADGGIGGDARKAHGASLGAPLARGPTKDRLGGAIASFLEPQINTDLEFQSAGVPP